MLVGTPKVKCVARQDPKAWEFNGRSGVSYKVEISDGTTNVQLPVSSADVWNMFKPFEDYYCTIEISQVAQDNRIATKCRIVDCKEAVD